MKDVVIATREEIEVMKKNTKEYWYKQGKLDGAKEFAEWLVRKNGYLDLFGNDSNELLAEWQKGEENE